MTRRIVGLLGWALWLFDVVVIVTSAILAIQARSDSQRVSLVGTYALILAFLGFPTVGALIDYRRAVLAITRAYSGVHRSALLSQQVRCAQNADRFGSSLRSEVELNHLTRSLVETVEQTMYPAHVSLWLRAPESERK